MLTAGTCLGPYEITRTRWRCAGDLHGGVLPFVSLGGDRGARTAVLEALRQGEAAGGCAGAQRRLTAAPGARAATPEGVTNLALARRWLYAGDHDRALASLERAYEDREPNLPYLGAPVWDPIRPDPRFQALVRRMRLPAAALAKSS